MLFRAVMVTAAVLMLAGCDSAKSWLGDAPAPPLPGKRVSVLTQAKAVTPDPGASAIEVKLPRPMANADWPMAGGLASHALYHMELGDAPVRQWSASIGEGSSTGRRLLAQPVVADGKVFTIDTASTVRAFDAAKGSRLWETELHGAADESAMGAGVAFDGGRLFVTTGFAQVIALDAASGKELWRTNTGAPMHGAPTARGGRVFAITVENQMLALAEDDGRVLWRHSGIAEVAGLLGSASPAVDGEVVVAPYNSGELFALRIDNGSELWSDSLSAGRRTDSVATLTDIRGLPVIDRGRVFAIANSDLMVAIDLRSGRRLWDREIGGIQTPWVAGDFIYVVSNAPELLAIEARTGKVRWVTPLQEWGDEDKTNRVVWTGPVLASDRLIVTSSNGWAMSVSPYTGDVLGKEELPAGVSIPPVVAGRSLYVLTDEGDLVAYH